MSTAQTAEQEWMVRDEQLRRKEKKMDEKITLTMDKDLALDMASMFEFYIFQLIRDDPDVDNIKCVAERIKVIDMIEKDCGEEGIL